MWLTFGILFLAGVRCTTTLTVNMECQPGWTNVGISCYKLFSDVLPWDNADSVCRRYGSQLLRTKDLREHDTIGSYVVDAGSSEIWIAYSSSRLPDQSVTPSYQDVRGNNISADQNSHQCVLARTMEGHVIWAHAPCERKSAFVCQCPAAPSGCFHCTNGYHVLDDFTCDGEDDCGDGSDEMNCPVLCTHHLSAQHGNMTSPGYPHGYPGHGNCVWLIEVPLGSNARLQFVDFSLEPDEDEVVVLAGGMTTASSRTMARLSGDLSDRDDRTYISNNNLLIVSFRSEKGSRHRGFSAIFTAVKAEGFQTHKSLTATTGPRDLYSPFYPSYLSSQDYTWVITTKDQEGLVTMEILDVDLMGDDRLLLRDGNSVYHPLLVELTSSFDASLSHLQSTGRHLYIAMQTRGLRTGRGFRFRYWQGCSMTLSRVHDNIVSPGYLLEGGSYPQNQTCTYDVSVPDAQSITVRFQTIEVAPSDHIAIYEGDNFVCNITGTSLPSPIDISFGSFRLVFRSDVSTSGGGFLVSYSIGCPKLHVNSWTLVSPDTHLPKYRYGSVVTFTCSQGFAFPADQNQTPENGSIVTECLQGGVWNISTTPACKPFCFPGWHYDVESEWCHQCPVGQFQSVFNSTVCQPCPVNTTTETPGTNSSAECKTSCPAGHRYSRTHEQCVPCPVGYYQDKSGQFRCHHCPGFKTTAEAGAHSVSLCNVEVLEKSEEGDIQDEGLLIVRMRHFHRRAEATSEGTVWSRRITPSPLELQDRLQEVQKPTDLFSLAEEFGYGRQKREVVEEDDLLDSGCGSGDDPCNITSGEPCNDTQVCVPDYTLNTYTCPCKAGYLENEHGDCVEFPDSQRLYLTTPLDLQFDPDLEQPPLESNTAWLSLKADCEEAFVSVFCGVEGFVSLKVMRVRPGPEGESTIVVYAVSFTVEVTPEMRIKVAQSVLSMEERISEIEVNGKNVSFAGYTGIFDTLEGTLTSGDDMAWCSDPSLYTCSSDQQCMDGGLRYSCQCPDDEGNIGGSCVSTAGLAGGLVVGLLVLVAIGVVVFFVIRRRRRNQRYKKCEDFTPEQIPSNPYSNIALREYPAAGNRLHPDGGETGGLTNLGLEESSVYDRTTDDTSVYDKTDMSRGDTHVYQGLKPEKDHSSKPGEATPASSRANDYTGVYETSTANARDSHLYEGMMHEKKGKGSTKKEGVYHNIGTHGPGHGVYENTAMGSST